MFYFLKPECEIIPVKKRVERYQRDNQDLSFEEKLGTRRQKIYGKRQVSLQNTSAKAKDCATQNSQKNLQKRGD